MHFPLMKASFTLCSLGVILQGRLKHFGAEMSSRSRSPMEQGEIEASPDLLHNSPGIILDPDDDIGIRQTTRGQDKKEKSGKSKLNQTDTHSSRSPDRHEDADDALNIQPPQIHLKKDKHRHHRHKESHKRSRDTEKYSMDSRHNRDDRLTRKYDDKSRSKHSKRELEMSSSSKEFNKLHLQQEREVEALRRQKSLQERERLERLERERHRIEKEKEQAYLAKMKRAEEESATRSDHDRRYRTDSRWREERERQNADEIKRRGKGNERKGRQRSTSHSRSPVSRTNPTKDNEESKRSSVSDRYRDNQRDAQKSWARDGNQRMDVVSDNDNEQYLRSKLLNKDDMGGCHHDDHLKAREDITRSSDHSHSNSEEELEEELDDEEDANSTASQEESEKSHENNADRSGSHISREEEDDVEEEEDDHHNVHDKMRSKFDERDDSPERSRENSVSSLSEDDGKDAKYIQDSPIPSSPEVRLPPYFPALQGCRNVEEFQCLNRIEEGTYGVVYRAIDLKTEEIVALKRLKMEKEKEGFPITSLREVNTLLKAQHPNIVTVREIVVGSNMDKIYIVMDYVEHDLKSLMEYMKDPFTIGEAKTLLQQLLAGVAHLHDNWIIHRDLKSSNLLLSHQGILKIGDFGLAREYGSPLRPYTPIVVTLWYRAPELLLGAKQYSIPIDMWSVGCLFAELLTRKPLFPGKSEMDQLNKIFKELGIPSEKIWPGVSELPGMKKCTFNVDMQYNQLQTKFVQLLSPNGLKLLNRFLTYNPEKRISAEDAKSHEFFKESPLPVKPEMFPTWPAKSEQTRMRTHGNSPKPPSGGKAFTKLLGDDEEYGSRFHLGGPAAGDLSKSSFALKFKLI